jgi:hypothetical protein
MLIFDTSGKKRRHTGNHQTRNTQTNQKLFHRIPPENNFKFNLAKNSDNRGKSVLKPSLLKEKGEEGC